VAHARVSQPLPYAKERLVPNGDRLMITGFSELTLESPDPAALARFYVV
jgi:hypothetical protein